MVVEIVLEVDVAIYAYADESSRARWVNQRFQLVGGADKRGVTTIEFDGLAVWGTELHIA